MDTWQIVVIVVAATSPHGVLSEMTDAGYRLIATHDVVRGYWSCCSR